MRPPSSSTSPRVGEPGPSHLSARPAGERVGRHVVPQQQRLRAGSRIVDDRSGQPRRVHDPVVQRRSRDRRLPRLVHRTERAPIGPRPVRPTRSAPPDRHPRPDRQVVHRTGTIEIASPVADAASLVTNVTIVHPDRAGFVTGFPAGTARPSTSTVNPAFFDHTLANLAITRVATRGVAYWSLGGADLIVDLTGVFHRRTRHLDAAGPTQHAESVTRVDRRRFDARRSRLLPPVEGGPDRIRSDRRRRIVSPTAATFVS